MAKEYTFEEICGNIQAGKFAPVYLLTGEEPYFIDKINDLLAGRVVDPESRDFNQIVLYGGDTNATSVIETARRFPMMSERQLIIVKEAQQIRDIDKLAFYVKNPLASTVLAVSYKNKILTKLKPLAVAFGKAGVLFESNKLPEYRLPAFITSYLKERGTTIDPKASQMLTDYIGNDLNRLSKELDKLLILLPRTGGKNITPGLIEENIGISKEYNNFELLKALSVKDILKANRIIRYFEKDPKNNPLQMTLSILFNYFSNLLIAFYAKDRSEKGIMNELGFRSPWQARDYMAGLRNYSPRKVFDLIGHIRTADAHSKGVDNPSATDGEILKELLYIILH